MGVPWYRSTDAAHRFDAFFTDEWGVVNAKNNLSENAAERVGFHKNIFTIVNGAVEREGGWTLGGKNRVNPHDDFEVRLVPSAEVMNQLKERQAGKPWVGEISVTLFYGVGSEIGRHGLRSIIYKAGGQHMLFHLRCNELTKPYYARTIDAAQIGAMLEHALGKPMPPWKVRVISGYSFGSSGVNQVILNELVDLSTVRRLVFYDCLYKLQMGSTVDAIKLLKRKAGSDLRIVVYKMSEGANSFVERKVSWRLSVVAENPGLIDRRGLVENLFHLREFQSLCLFRCLDGAVKDGVVSLPKNLQILYDQLAPAVAKLPRGTLISNLATWKYVRGTPPVGMDFTTWVKENSKAVAAFGAKLGKASVKGTFRGIVWPNSLPGWWDGEEEDVHDLVIPEIGWEYLTL